MPQFKNRFPKDICLLSYYVMDYDLIPLDLRKKAIQLKANSNKANGGGFLFTILFKT